MKTKIHIALLLTSLVFISSGCSRFLDVKPAGEVIPTTPEDYSSLLHDLIYQVEQNEDPFLIGDVTHTEYYDTFTDNFEPAIARPSSPFQFYLGQYVSISYASQDPYGYYYSRIAQSNIIIDKTPNDGSTLYKNLLTAAYTVRGIAYFQLMRLYCQPPKIGATDAQLGVPMVTSFDLETQQPRGTLSQLIQSVEDDLHKAIELGGDDPDYMFTAEVAQGYLARHYFWTQQWDKAIEVATKLVQTRPIVTANEYKTMFESQKKSGNMLLKSNLIANNDRVQSRIRDYASAPLSKRFTALFERDNGEKDIRKQLFISDRRTSKKYATSCLRSAEFLLIAAESYAHLGKEQQALDLVNELRQKRIQDTPPLTINTLLDIPQDDLIQVDAQGKPLTKLMSAILTERRKELFMEGDRFFELKRNGSPAFSIYYNGYKYDIKPFMYSLPIPPSDIYIQGSSLQQNPEYEKYTIGLPKQ